MSKLRFNITMSLDGFVAGPNRASRSLGVGGKQLHTWLVPLAAFSSCTATRAARSTPAPRLSRGGSRTSERR
jgi:hypothetical protein